MVDCDYIYWLEIDHQTAEPLALIETALDYGQRRKTATATKRLAQRASLPAYTVLYTPSRAPNPADPSQFDIEQFRVKRLWPSPENRWRVLTPAEWASALLQIRQWAARRIDTEAANDPNYGE